MNNRTCAALALIIPGGILIITAAILISRWQGVDKVPRHLKYEDMSQWRKVDPERIAYEEKDPVKTGFSSLNGIHVDVQGTVYAAGNSGVRQFGPSGRREGEWKTEEPVTCVTCDREGTLYAGQKTGIRIFKNNGTSVSWGTKGRRKGEFMNITALAVQDWNLFAADAGNRCVHRFTLEGDFINDIGRKDPDTGESGLIIRSLHLDVALAEKNRICVVNPGMHSIATYTFNGEKLSSWGTYGTGIKGFSGCCNPTHIALTPDGTFVTSEKNIPRIKIYSRKGIFRHVVAPPSSFDRKCDGMDLGVDGAGRIYAADPVQRTVRIFVKKVSNGSASEKEI